MVQFVYALWFCMSAAPNDPHMTQMFQQDIQGHVYLNRDYKTAYTGSLMKCVYDGGHGRSCYTSCVQLPSQAQLRRDAE